MLEVVLAWGGVSLRSSSNRNLHPRVKVDQAGRPLPPKKT